MDHIKHKVDIHRRHNDPGKGATPEAALKALPEAGLPLITTDIIAHRRQQAAPGLTNGHHGNAAKQKQQIHQHRITGDTKDLADLF